MNVFIMTMLSGAAVACLAGDTHAQTIPMRSVNRRAIAQADLAGLAAFVSDTSASRAGWRADAHCR